MTVCDEERPGPAPARARGKGTLGAPPRLGRCGLGGPGPRHFYSNTRYSNTPTAVLKRAARTCRRATGLGGAEGRTAALNRTVNHLETRLNSAPIPTGRPRRGCAKPPRSGAHAQTLHRERIHAIPAHWQHASIRHHGALAAPSTRRTACPRSSRAQGRRRCLLSLLFQPKIPPRGRYP